MTIQTYFSHIKTLIDTYGSTQFVLETDLNFETRPGGQGYLRGQIAFFDGSRLHFSEYLDQTGDQPDKLMYTYHYQDANDHLVFRYDNAQHRPPLPSPEHKHLPDQIVEAASPTLDDVLTEVVSLQNWTE